MSCSAYSGYANKKGMSEPALSQVLRVSYRSVITTAMLPEVDLSEHTAHSDEKRDLLRHGLSIDNFPHPTPWELLSIF